MKASLIPVFILLTSLNVSAQRSNDFKLPKTWTKDFTISLSFTGSMDGSQSHITFTHDSCKYIRNSGMQPAKKSFFSLSEADRAEILKKMHELNVDKIHPGMDIGPVNDGWSTSLCFGSHCINGGISVKLSDPDRIAFSSAYEYLEAFAEKRSKER